MRLVTRLLCCLGAYAWQWYNSTLIQIYHARLIQWPVAWPCLCSSWCCLDDDGAIIQWYRAFAWSCMMMMMLMLTCCLLLYESPRRKPGWRFTAGLTYARKLQCAQVGPRTNLSPDVFQIAISRRLGHLRTFPLARLELFGQSLCHLNLSSFGWNWNRELGAPVTGKMQKVWKTLGFWGFLQNSM